MPKVSTVHQISDHTQQTLLLTPTKNGGITTLSIRLSAQLATAVGGYPHIDMDMQWRSTFIRISNPHKAIRQTGCKAAH
jgi:hypothetical protein